MAPERILGGSVARRTAAVMSLAAVVVLASVAAPHAADEAPSAMSEADVDAIYPDVEALYIDLHRNPELAFQETRTAGRLADILKSLGYDVTTNVGRTGIVGVMKNGAGPVVMLRTDLDALPVAEETGLPFASVATTMDPNGRPLRLMHACGHDIHMAAWTGTARLMARNRDRWSGTLLLVGQPAEEIGGGATAMLQDGLFTRFPRPDYALALHVDDTMPAGTIGYRAGLFRAVSDTVTVTVFGRGGHAAMPHNTVDPVVLASKIVLALQTIVSRENNPVDPVVVTVGSIHGGTRANIVPDEVRLELSVRTLKPEVRERTLAAIRRIARGEALAAGAPKEPLVETPDVARPPVINDPALTQRVAAALKKALGETKVVEMPSKMTSEDFAEYGVAGVPALLVHIGAVDAAKLAEAHRTGVAVPAPHSPQFAPEREPTLKGAIRAETAALLALLGGK